MTTRGKTDEMVEKGLYLILLWAMASGLIAGILESLQEVFFAPSRSDRTVFVLSMLLGAGVVYWIRFTKSQSRGKIGDS